MVKFPQHVEWNYFTLAKGSTSLVHPFDKVLDAIPREHKMPHPPLCSQDSFLPILKSSQRLVSNLIPKINLTSTRQNEVRGMQIETCHQALPTILTKIVIDRSFMSTPLTMYGLNNIDRSRCTDPSQ